MPTFTEDVSDSLALSGAFGPSEYTTSKCASFVLSSALDHNKVVSLSDGLALASSASFYIGYDVVDSIGLGAAPSQTASQALLAASGIVLQDLVSQVLAAMPATSLGLAAVATHDTLVPVSATFELTDVASAVRSVTSSASEGLVISDVVVTVVEHNETESFGIGVVPSVEIDASLVDTIGISQASAPSAIATALVQATLALSSTANQATIATTAVVDGFVLGDRPLVIDATYPTIWANSERMALATWQQTPYESYALVGGRLLAAGEDGLYAFGAAQDDTGVVNAAVKGDLSDFGSEQKKVFDAVNVSGVLGAPLRVTITTELGSYSYNTHLPSSTKMMTHQAKPGRGLTGRYVRFAIDNQVAGDEGADFSINEIMARVGDSARVR